MTVFSILGRTISSAVPAAFAFGQLFRRDISEKIRQRVGQTPGRFVTFRKLRMIPATHIIIIILLGGRQLLPV